MTEVMRPPLAMPPFDYSPRPYEGPSREEVLALRRQYVHPALFTLYREPLMIVEGKMQYLFDQNGRRYLDLFAGIVTVSCGHCMPRRSISIPTFPCWRRSWPRKCRRVSTSPIS